MTKKNAFITQFNRESGFNSSSDCVKFTALNKVKKSLSYATDINTIYQNFCTTGNLPLNGNQPIYDENFIKYDSLVEAQQAVKEASLYFQTLPPHIRKQYGNSLEKFVFGIHSNDDFLIKEGVLKKIEKEAPVPAPAPAPVEPTVPVAPPVNTAPTEVL